MRGVDVVPRQRLPVLPRLTSRFLFLIPHFCPHTHHLRLTSRFLLLIPHPHCSNQSQVFLDLSLAILAKTLTCESRAESAIAIITNGRCFWFWYINTLTCEVDQQFSALAESAMFSVHQCIAIHWQVFLVLAAKLKPLAALLLSATLAASWIATVRLISIIIIVIVVAALVVFAAIIIVVVVFVVVFVATIIIIIVVLSAS